MSSHSAPDANAVAVTEDGVVLLPELLLHVMKELQAMAAKKTLATLMRASRGCYALGLPVLWERLILQNKKNENCGGFTREMMRSLANDLAKLKHVRELEITYHVEPRDTALTILRVCLPNLRLLAADFSCSLKDYWTMLTFVGKHGAPLLETLVLNTDGFYDDDVVLETDTLPESLRHITLTVSPEPCMEFVWAVLANLPKLETLRLPWSGSVYTSPIPLSYLSSYPTLLPKIQNMQIPLGYLHDTAVYLGKTLPELGLYLEERGEENWPARAVDARMFTRLQKLSGALWKADDLESFLPIWPDCVSEAVVTVDSLATNVPALKAAISFLSRPSKPILRLVRDNFLNNGTTDPQDVALWQRIGVELSGF